MVHRKKNFLTPPLTLVLYLDTTKLHKLSRGLRASPFQRFDSESWFIFHPRVGPGCHESVVPTGL